ncbi:putative ribonuclease H-like domain-containing protein [Tanacetum coccineum]
MTLTQHSTCQSNDSKGSCGNTSEHFPGLNKKSISVPNEMSTSRSVITNEKVVSELQEVEPSCAKHVKTPRQQMKDQATPKVNRKNWNAMMEREQGEGYSFTKKKCFVCGSLSHLIKDCDYYERNGKSVQLNAGRPNTNSVRPNINTGRTNINSVRPRVNAVSSNVNTVRSRQPEHHLGKKNMVDRGIFNSVCSGHMTGNKNQLKDFKEFNGGSVTFGDTLSVLGKFDGKSDEGFLVGYSLNSKAYRVYNLVTKRVEVNLHVNFLEDKPNVKGVGYRWMFDIDYLTDSMNYIPVSLENQANPHAGASEVTNSAGTPTSIASEEKDEEVELIVVPSTVRIPEEKVESRTSSTNSKKEDSLADSLEDNAKIQAFRRELEEVALKHLGTVPENNTTSTPSVNTGSQTVNTGRLDHDDSLMPELEIFHKPETGIFEEASYDEEGVITDFNSLPTEIEVSPTPTLRIHSIHPKSQILGDPKSVVQTRSKVQNKLGAHALLSHIHKQQRNNHKDQQHCLFAYFLSQEEPKKIAEALQDDSWVQAMQEELLQFKLQQVWVLVDLPHGMKVIGTKWVYRNKRDERGVVVRNKERFGEELPIKTPKILKEDKDDEAKDDEPTKKSGKRRKQMARFKLQTDFHETKMPLTNDEEAFDECTLSSYLNAVKRIFKYLKGKPNLGLWYPRESPFDLEAFSDSDYGGSNLDRKSTTGGCQFLGQRRISWQWHSIGLWQMQGRRYALISNPTIYDSLVKQFWQTATANTNADEALEIKATIDTISYKSGGWDQFGSNIATALICLSTGKFIKFSKLIFDGIGVENIEQARQKLYDDNHDFCNDPKYSIGRQTSLSSCELTKKEILGNYEKGVFEGFNTFNALPMLLVATNPKWQGQEHAAVAQSQPSFINTQTVVLSIRNKKNHEAQGGRSQDDPTRLLQYTDCYSFYNKSKTSREEQVEDIVQTLLKQPKLFIQVASYKAQVYDKEGDNKRRKRLRKEHWNKISTVWCKTATSSPDNGKEQESS